MVEATSGHLLRAREQAKAFSTTFLKKVGWFSREKMADKDKRGRMTIKTLRNTFSLYYLFMLHTLKHKWFMFRSLFGLILVSWGREQSHSPSDECHEPSVSVGRISFKVNENPEVQESMKDAILYHYPLFRYICWNNHNVVRASR